jgi:hypothetical protein
VEANQMIVNPRNLEDRILVNVRSIELVKALEQYFDTIWEKSESIDRLPGSLV